MKRWLSSSLVAAAALFACVASGAVRADVPPDPGYVEKCTVENHKTATNECVLCSTYHGDMDKCEREHGSKGLLRACRTGGASVWSEVWCKGGAAAATPEPAAATEPAPAETPKSEAPKADSPKCAGGQAESMLALGLAGLWLAARARVRRSA